MRLAHLTFALVTLLMLPACNTEAGANAQPADVATKIVDTLKGITDGDTANAAKTQLSSLTDQLAKAMESLKSAGGALADKAGGAGGGLADAAKDLAGKAADAFAPQLKQALSGISEQVSRLMNIESVTAAIGPILEKLKGLVTV